MHIKIIIKMEPFKFGPSTKKKHNEDYSSLIVLKIKVFCILLMQKTASLTSIIPLVG